MNRIAATMLIIAGIVHLLPLPGLLGAPQLVRLYGVPIDDPNLVLLMRHRALMFGLLGALLVAAAFRPELRPLACVAGLASAAGFLAIAWSVGGWNAAIARVVAADVVALLALAVAAGVELAARRG